MKKSFLRALFVLASLALGSVAWAQRSIDVVVTGNQLTGTGGSVAVVLTATGAEAAVGFTLSFDPAVLQYKGFTNGKDLPPGITVIKNEMSALVNSGRFAFAILLDSGTNFGTAGAKELVNVKFDVLAGNAASTISFTDSPTIRKVTDLDGIPLAAVFNNKVIAANLPPAAPAIVTQPGNQTVTSGQNATFTAAAGGNPPPSLTWQKSTDAGVNWITISDGGRFSGATTASLLITGALTTDAASYRVAATNTQGSVNSSAATLTVSKAAQTITFGSLAGVPFGASPFGLTATASSGLPVSYSSSNPSVAAVSGSTITVVGSGSTVITASQTGNSEFNAATAVLQSLTVGQASQSITFGSLAAKTYGDASFTLAASATSGLSVAFASSDTNVATISGNTVTIVGAGTATITASQAGNTNFAAATSVSQSLTVTKKNQTITFGALSPKAFNAAPFTLGATVDSPLTVSYTSSNAAVATVAGNTVTIVGVGNTTLTAIQAGNGNYSAAASIQQTLAVVPAIQTISFAAIPARTFAPSDAFTLSSTASSGLTVSYASSNAAVATVSGSTVTVVGVGSTTITASQAGNASFGAAVDVTQVLTVNKAAATVTLGNLAATYDGAAKSVTAATAPVGLNVTFTYAGSATVPVIAGTYAVVATINDNNYSGTASGSLVIAKATQAITFGALAAKTFNDAAFDLAATTSSPLVVGYSSSNTAVATISGKTVTIVGAGSTVITASQTGDANYLAAATGTQTLVVNKAAATVTLGNLAATYNTTPKAATATTTPTGLTVAFTYDASASAPTNAGTYAVVGTISNANYAGSASGNLVITKAPQTITFAALLPRALDEVSFGLGGTADSGLALTYVSSDTNVATIGGANGTTATLLHTGTTSITASQAGNNNYLAAAPITQSLTVLNASQTITFAGTELSGKTFGDPAFALTAASNRGLAVSFISSNPNVATVAGNIVTIIGAGTATITAKQLGNSDFAAAPDVARTLVVAKAVAPVTLGGGLSPTYDGSPKAATATTVPAGLTVTFTYAGSATVPTNVGTYAVVATLVDANYSGAASGSLVIAKATQAITFGALAAKTFNDAAFDLAATTSSPLVVGYSSSNTAVATISGKTVTIVGAGSTVITASQTGDANYLAAATGTQTLVVNKAAATVTLGNLAATYNTTPKAATATTTPTGLTVAFTYDASASAPTNAGTYAVVGTISNANYAGSASGNLVITKAPQTITFAALLPRALDEVSFGLGGTADSGLALTYVSSDTNVATIGGANGTTATLLHTGTTSITASQAGNNNYLAAAPITQSLTVLNASQTITFAGTELSGKTFGDPAFALTAASNRGLAVSFISSNPNVATVAGNIVTIIGAGTATITAKQLGNSDFAAAPDVARTLTVAKKVATGTLNTLAQIFDGTPRAVTATTTPTGLSVTFTYASSITAPTNVGTYAVVGTINDVNYSGSIIGTLAIAKAPQTITFAALPAKLVSAAPFALSATASSGLAVTYASSNSAVATVSGGTVTLVGIGSTTISVSQVGDSNYSAASNVTQTLTVNPIAPVILSTPPLAATAVQGRGFLFGPISLNNTPATFTATGLTGVGTPDGLAVSSVLGSIAGTPVNTGTFSIVLTATNITGSDSRTISLTVQAPPPVITSPASVSGRVGTAFSFNVVASNSPSSYAATNLPAGLAINSGTGAITGTPTADGTSSVQLTATNSSGSVSQPLVIVINPPLNAPVYAGTLSPSGTQGTAFSFTPAFGTVTAPYALAGTLPTGLAFTAATGVVAGTPTQTGSFPVVLSATNAGGTSSVRLTFVVNAAATAPVITSSSIVPSARVGTAFSFQLTSSGTPAATSYGASTLPAGLSLAAGTGLITGTPTAFGSFDISVSATNSVGTGPAAILTISIAPSASAPVITSSPVVNNAQVGQPFSFTLTASPAAVTFAVTSGTLPSGLALNAASGTITGTPLAAALGQTRVWFAGTNGSGSGLAMEVLFSIAPAASTPVVTSNGSALAQVGQFFQFAIKAANGPLTAFAATNRPAWLALDANTGVLSGIPTEATSTPIVIALTATNLGGAGNPKNLALTVAPAPATPVIMSALTVSGRAGNAFTYQISASQTPTSFVATGLPPGLLLNSATGEITGSPTVSNAFNVAIRAANAGGLGAPATLVVDIAPALLAPAITSAPSAAAQVGVAFSYQTVATNGPIVSYAANARQLPIGLSLNTATGVLSGTPSDDPRIYPIELTATNAGGTSLPQVLNVNLAPALGVPVVSTPLYVDATVGSDFTLTITASNLTGSAPYAPPIIFEAIGLPSGLAVNPATGTIAGRPTTVGSVLATLIATNASGTGPARDFTINVKPAQTAPVVGGASIAIGQVNQPFTYQIAASNAPTSYEVLGGPAWIGLDSSSGAVAGTPTAPGTVSVKLTASNASGTSSPVGLDLIISPAANTPVVTSTRTAEGTVGSAFTYTPVATPAAASYTVSGLPGGLSFNFTTGAITGAPNVSGLFTVVLTPSNANGVGAPAALTLTIKPNVTFGP